MSVKTVKVSNLSLGASQRDVREFFSFSGDVVYVEVQSNDERSQNAFVTFTDSQGTETAVLLSGATIGDMTITVTLAPDYQLPPDAIPSLPPHGGNTSSEGESAFRKAEDVVSSMFAKGFVLGKDVVSKAKSFDEKHGLTSTASAKVTSFDKKIGFTEKVSTGTSIVNEKVKEVDQKLQVSEKAKSAFAAAEQTVSNAGSAIMKNRYVFTSAAWVTGAFNKVAKAASEVGQQTKEKVGQAEDEQKHKMVDDFAQVHLSESPKAASVPTEQQPPPSKPAPVQGLIL
ncbi:binding partner of ACD11 1-like [Cynara cardunculus var. scolymus]|uniref:binding partner of ACD11 1-like n=1 Tax=Cynara cardunculus var. scolymus TaxID=59895 RepID=UPI000D625751|nr:binding partner of ACD11 1-like [Cynara cardunculus var. scolymus]